MSTAVGDSARQAMPIAFFHWGFHVRAICRLLGASLTRPRDEPQDLIDVIRDQLKKDPHFLHMSQTKLFWQMPEGEDSSAATEAFGTETERNRACSGSLCTLFVY